MALPTNILNENGSLNLDSFIKTIQEQAKESDLENFMLEISLRNSMQNVLLAKRPKHRGSMIGRKVVSRDIVAGAKRIFADYFSENPVFSETQFRRRFRMRRALFLRILLRIQGYDDYFTQKKDALGRLGLSPLQKATAAMRMLAYGFAADATDEYIRIGEETARQCCYRFTDAVIACFE